MPAMEKPGLGGKDTLRQLYSIVQVDLKSVEGIIGLHTYILYIESRLVVLRLFYIFDWNVSSAGVPVFG